jgi:hypothetical protein
MNVNRRVSNLELITSKTGVSLQNTFAETAIGAFGTQKSFADLSLLGCKFTDVIRDTRFIGWINGVEQETLNNNTNIQSINNTLTIQSGNALNDDTVLRTKRTPNYQENRGILYSSSIFLPDKDANGIRRFGLFTSENGVYFTLENGLLYACARSNGIEWHKEDITEQVEDLGSDLERGNIFDIQLQWRGVGNIKFFIGDPETATTTILKTPLLDATLFKREELTISNPALPISYQCINDGDNVIIKSGCADLTTEGGKEPRYGVTIISNFEDNIKNIPLLSIKIPNTFESGQENTVNFILSALRLYVEKKGNIYVYLSRNTNVFDQNFTDYYDYETPLQVVYGGNTPVLNGALDPYLIFRRYLDDRETTTITNPIPDADFFLYPGDILTIIPDKDGEVSCDVWVGYER